MAECGPTDARPPSILPHDSHTHDPLDYSLLVLQPVKSSDFPAIKTKVAQMLTVRREKEITQGIDRRTAVKIEKNALLKEGALVR